VEPLSIFGGFERTLLQESLGGHCLYLGSSLTSI